MYKEACRLTVLSSLTPETRYNAWQDAALSMSIPIAVASADQDSPSKRVYDLHRCMILTTMDSGTPLAPGNARNVVVRAASMFRAEQAGEERAGSRMRWSPRLRRPAFEHPPWLRPQPWHAERCRCTRTCFARSRQSRRLRQDATRMFGAGGLLLRRPER